VELIYSEILTSWASTREGWETATFYSFKREYPEIPRNSPKIHLVVVGFQFCEISKEFELLAGRGHPRSSILVSIVSAYATFYL